MSSLLNIGFGNFVPINQVVALVIPDSAPIKRKIREAEAQNMLVDVTMGRRTRSVLILKSGHVVLSGIQAATVARRLDQDDTSLDEES